MCESNVDEIFLCHYASAGVFHLCNDNFLSQSERAAIGSCYDTVYNWFNTCKVFQSSGIEPPEGFEPVEYYEKSAPTEINAWYRVMRMMDHVCHPYSYYHPEF